MGFCISGRCQGLDTIRIGGTALFGVQTVGQDFFDGWSMVITLWKGPGWSLYDVDGMNIHHSTSRHEMGKISWE